MTKRYRVINRRGVHSMAAGMSWYKDNFILETQLPPYFLEALLHDGAIVEEIDQPEVQPTACAGLTAKGNACKRAPIEGSEYCNQHQPEKAIEQ